MATGAAKPRAPHTAPRRRPQRRQPSQPGAHRPRGQAPALVSEEREGAGGRQSSGAAAARARLPPLSSLKHPFSPPFFLTPFVDSLSFLVSPRVLSQQSGDYRVVGMPQLSGAGGGGGGDPELCATDEMIPFKDEGDPQKEKIFAEISHPEEEGDLADIKSSLVNESEIIPASNGHEVSGPDQQEAWRVPRKSREPGREPGRPGDGLFEVPPLLGVGWMSPLVSILPLCVCACARVGWEVQGYERKLSPRGPVWGSVAKPSVWGQDKLTLRHNVWPSDFLAALRGCRALKRGCVNRVLLKDGKENALAIFFGRCVCKSALNHQRLRWRRAEPQAERKGRRAWAGDRRGQPNRRLAGLARSGPAEWARAWAAGAVWGSVRAAARVPASGRQPGAVGVPSRTNPGGPRSTAHNTRFLQPSSLL